MSYIIHTFFMNWKEADPGAAMRPETGGSQQ